MALRISARPSVVEGDTDGDVAVVLGEIDGFADGCLNVRGQSVDAAEVDEADAPFVEILGLVFNCGGEELKEACNLFLGASPVLGGEGVEGEVLDAVFGEAVNDGADVGDTSAMALETGQVAALGPSSIAIHDYGHVTGNWSEGRGRAFGLHYGLWLDSRLFQNSISE